MNDLVIKEEDVPKLKKYINELTVLGEGDRYLDDFRKKYAIFYDDE